MAEEDDDIPVDAPDPDKDGDDTVHRDIWPVDDKDE